MPQLLNITSLRARQPPKLMKTNVHRTIPPADLTKKALELLAKPVVFTNPAAILNVYRKHVQQDAAADVSVLIRAFVQLGFVFDPNSFFSTGDKQSLTGHKYFKCLAHDLAAARKQIPHAAAPVLLYAMSCLEYRCAPLLPTLLDFVERDMTLWTTPILCMLLHSTAWLGMGNGGPVVFDVGEGTSRDYGDICEKLLRELHIRISHETHPEASFHDYTRAAFATAMAGLYDSGTSSAALPLLVQRACDLVDSADDLDQSGWAQFFLYQTLYCVDVEKPACEEAVKRAMPMWIQERLHHRWLDSIVLMAQPQGADRFQKEVDVSLRRTNTQALLNCSFGREWDEQHCWFGGFVLEPKISLELDSYLPLGPGRPRPSGWLAMKSRILKKVGYTVVTFHRCFWDRLTEDQQDEQILRLRAQLGYVHNKELEEKTRRVRQKPHTYKGVESKKSDWKPEPMPQSS